MACHLFGAKPLSKPIMTSHQSHPKEQTSMEYHWNKPIFIDKIALILSNFFTFLSRGRWVTDWTIISNVFYGDHQWILLEKCLLKVQPSFALLTSESTEPGIILCMCPAIEKRRYSVTPSLIGWAHTLNDPYRVKWMRYQVVYQLQNCLLIFCKQ